ncbi:ankyrin repeat domain-containing protein 49-like [Neocloeon triangulifer]|uniref:ankyrin repeat domain-containing protein 49-like n=1 Tax=Neocloeon triangulifer TaxID=2078957 RepID=UPI00286EF79D|nr:ankyrin repeat domain-containing protein 49-like [Neocloeon triangulifer]
MSDLDSASGDDEWLDVSDAERSDYPEPPEEEIFDPENYAFRDHDYTEPRPTDASPEEDFLWAAQAGEMQIAEELLQKNPELIRTQDSDGYTPLHRACYSNKVEMVDFLLSKGAPIDLPTTDGWLPLHSACKWGNHRCAIKLLMHGAPINAASGSGQTALHIAASCRSDKKCLKLLLSWPGLDPDLKNAEGETAYDKALINTKQHYLFNAVKKCTKEI